MKLTGTLLLIFCTSLTGALISQRAKSRVEICRELIILCDLLKLDMGYKNTVLSELISEFNFKKLDFLNMDVIKNKGTIVSPLSKEENEETARFLYALGKSDCKRQLLLIDGYREYASHMLEKYKSLYDKNSKLYICFGFFGGAVISLALL